MNLSGAILRRILISAGRLRYTRPIRTGANPDRITDCDDWALVRNPLASLSACRPDTPSSRRSSFGQFHHPFAVVAIDDHGDTSAGADWKFVREWFGENQKLRTELRDLERFRGRCHEEHLDKGGVDSRGFGYRNHG